MFHILTITFHILGIAVNIAGLILCLPRKKPLPIAIASFFVVFIMLLIIDRNFVPILQRPNAPKGITNSLGSFVRVIIKTSYRVPCADFF